MTVQEGGSPCFDPSFPDMTAASFYWSATPRDDPPIPGLVWGVDFRLGLVDWEQTPFAFHARAIRGDP